MGWISTFWVRSVVTWVLIPRSTQDLLPVPAAVSLDTALQLGAHSWVILSWRRSGPLATVDILFLVCCLAIGPYTPEGISNNNRPNKKKRKKKKKKKKKKRKRKRNKNKNKNNNKNNNKNENKKKKKKKKNNNNKNKNKNKKNKNNKNKNKNKKVCSHPFLYYL